MQVTLLLGVLLAFVDIWIYTIELRAGLVLSGFVVLYLILSLINVYFAKTVLAREMISFATSYGQIQKMLLRDFEVAPSILIHFAKLPALLPILLAAPMPVKSLS